MQSDKSILDKTNTMLSKQVLLLKERVLQPEKKTLKQSIYSLSSAFSLFDYTCKSMLVETGKALFIKNLDSYDSYFKLLNDNSFISNFIEHRTPWGNYKCIEGAEDGLDVCSFLDEALNCREGVVQTDNKMFNFINDTNGTFSYRNIDTWYGAMHANTLFRYDDIYSMFEYFNSMKVPSYFGGIKKPNIKYRPLHKEALFVRNNSIRVANGSYMSSVINFLGKNKQYINSYISLLDKGSKTVKIKDNHSVTFLELAFIRSLFENFLYNATAYRNERSDYSDQLYEERECDCYEDDECECDREECTYLDEYCLDNSNLYQNNEANKGVVYFG